MENSTSSGYSITGRELSSAVIEGDAAFRLRPEAPSFAPLDSGMTVPTTDAMFGSGIIPSDSYGGGFTTAFTSDGSSHSASAYLSSVGYAHKEADDHATTNLIASMAAAALDEPQFRFGGSGLGSSFLNGGFTAAAKPTTGSKPAPSPPASFPSGAYEPTGMPSSPSKGVEVIVSGLPLNWTAQVVTDLLSFFGPIIRVNLMPPRAPRFQLTAIAEFVDGAQAREAVDMLDQFPVHAGGWLIHPRDPQLQRKKLEVRRDDSIATLRLQLGDSPSMSRATVPGNSPEMLHRASSASTLVDSLSVRSVPLSARDSMTTGNETRDEKSSARVFVARIPLSVGVEPIFQLLSRFGRLSHRRVLPQRRGDGTCAGMATFCCKEDAETAVQLLNGMPLDDSSPSLVLDPFTPTYLAQRDAFVRQLSMDTPEMRMLRRRIRFLRVEHAHLPGASPSAEPAPAAPRMPVPAPAAAPRPHYGDYQQHYSFPPANAYMTPVYASDFGRPERQMSAPPAYGVGGGMPSFHPATMGDRAAWMARAARTPQTTTSEAFGSYYTPTSYSMTASEATYSGSGLM